ncbi:MAG TPA: hypothetical protein VFN46_00535 [Acetobacteraceae bacterium]|nr:hypothetical protein [Acetobacteraceae bacterium]
MDIGVGPLAPAGRQDDAETPGRIDGPRRPPAPEGDGTEGSERARLLAELAGLRRERVLLLHSATWRVVAGLRTFAHILPPRLRRRLSGLVRAAWQSGRRALPCWTPTARLRRRIEDSGLFDAGWYLRAYPDVALAGIDPLAHYLAQGAADRRSPGARFDAARYLAAYPDIAAAGLNPLLHFLRHGEAEGRIARPVPPIAAPGHAPGVPSDRATRHAGRMRHLGRDRAATPADGVAIGIVTHDPPADELRAALAAAEASLRRAGGHGAARILVIDNGAPSGAADLLPGCAVLPAHGNIGFGAGHNALMQAAFAQGASLYVAVNPDGLLHPDAIGALWCMAEAAEGRALVEALQFPDEHPKPYDPVTFATPWASGACLAIPRRIHRAIGGFDEGFFLYCEDVDLSWRARAAGFAVKLCPPALFLHRTTNRGEDARRRRLLHAAGRRLALKWGDDAFAARCARALPARLAREAAAGVVPVAEEARAVADFAHLFHFAPARW